MTGVQTCALPIFKADALERGVNSLGQNASAENIARLKAIIQKTVEDKRKESGK